MPLDQSFVGRSYPPTAPYQVGREKIREFAAAIGATDAGPPRPGGRPGARLPGRGRAAHLPDRADRWRRSSVIIDDPELGLDYSRVVHGDQRFAYARPIVAGDELVCVNTVDGDHRAAAGTTS